MLMQALMKAIGTRGKRLVVLVGQKKAVAIAVRNVSGRRRWSKLGEWLHAVRAGPDEAVGRLPHVIINNIKLCN